MRRTSGLLLLLLVAAVFAGCGAKADAPAKKWIDFLDKHKAAMEANSFDVEAFKKEGKPIADELKAVKDPKEDKILMTQSVLDEWNRANKEFGEAADIYASKSGDMAVVQAYLELVTHVTGEDPTK